MAKNIPRIIVMSVDRFIKKNKRKVNEKISLRQEVTVSTIVYTAWIFTFCCYYGKPVAKVVPAVQNTPDK